MDSASYARWTHVVRATFCAAVVLIASTLYGVIDGDDARGIAASLVPGLACVGLWRLAVWRRDR